MKTAYIYRYFIYGSKKLSNFFIASIIFLGSLSFFSIAIITFLQDKGYLKDISFNIIFFPQGLIMGFYGSLGIIISLYLFLNSFFQVGLGFNEFNKKDNILRIFRWGIPGKNRRLQFCYALNDIKSIKVITNPQKTIFICFKGDYEIPLFKANQITSFEVLENKAIDIASFLNIPLFFL